MVPGVILAWISTIDRKEYTQMGDTPGLWPIFALLIMVGAPAAVRRAYHSPYEAHIQCHSCVGGNPEQRGLDIFDLRGCDGA